VGRAGAERRIRKCTQAALHNKNLSPVILVVIAARNLQIFSQTAGAWAEL
jgi:hypothetical protein